MQQQSDTPVTNPDDRPCWARARPWILLAVLLTVLRIWLSRGQAVFAIGGAMIDDRLFIDLADALLRGDWLGDYKPMTLAKGPFYSMWIAAMYALGVPLRLSELLACIGAGILVVAAFAPIVKMPWQRFLIYALLLWNPMGFEMQTLGRVLRQNIYVPVSLALLACVLALGIRAGASFKRLLPWALGGGLLFAAFYLIREESVWIAPCIVLVLLYSSIVAWRRGSARALLPLGGAWATGLLVSMLPILLVCSLNQKYYGWFGTVEFRATEFKDAYGALLRVTQMQPIPRVPVTREARERIYEVSPAFSELRPYLEGPMGHWAGSCSEFVTGIPGERREMAGGWFMWALRDSVAAAGQAKDSRTAMAYYARLAREVNEACDAGKLAGGPRRSGFLPPWREGNTAWLLKSFVEFADYFISFRGFTAYAPASQGDEGNLPLFRKLTGEKLSADPSPAFRPYAFTRTLDSWRTGALQTMGKLMRNVLFWLILACQILLFVRLIQSLIARRLGYLTLAAVAVWGACAASVLINAMVNVTSFPTLGTGAFAQIYPFIILFCGLVIVDWSLPRPAK